MRLLTCFKLKLIYISSMSKYMTSFSVIQILILKQHHLGVDAKR